MHCTSCRFYSKYLNISLRLMNPATIFVFFFFLLFSLFCGVIILTANKQIKRSHFYYLLEHVAPNPHPGVDDCKMCLIQQLRGTLTLGWCERLWRTSPRRLFQSRHVSQTIRGRVHRPGFGYDCSWDTSLSVFHIWAG